MNLPDTSDRLQKLNDALERRMLFLLPPALKHPDSSLRKSAIRLILDWRSMAAMELLYTTAGKYDVPASEIDCEDGILKGCMVFCCRKLYVRITEEDVADGVEMHPGMPWFIRVKPQGCYALDPHNHRCTIWEKRPIACRLFNCKTDKRYS